MSFMSSSHSLNYDSSSTAKRQSLHHSKVMKLWCYVLFKNHNKTVMTGQRRVDPLAAIFIRQNQSGNGQRAEQEYQRQSRDNTRQGLRSQAQVQSSKVGQSGVKHRDSRMNNAQKCQPGQEQDFAVSACESAA